MFAKEFRSIGCAASLCVAGLLAAPAHANTGLITFQGQVSDSTCDVRGGTAAAPSFLVNLPHVSANQLAPGGVAGRTLFRMALENCAAVANGVRVFFEGGPTVDPASGTLMTAVPDVHFALFNADGTPIVVGDESQRDTNTLYQPNEAMHYQVAYKNVGTVIAPPGSAASSVVYSLHYP